MSHCNTAVRQGGAAREGDRQKALLMKLSMQWFALSLSDWDSNRPASRAAANEGAEGSDSDDDWEAELDRDVQANLAKAPSKEDANL